MENNYNLLDKVTISISARINNIDNEIKKMMSFMKLYQMLPKKLLVRYLGSIKKH
jgi:hypothetical protein